MTVRKILRIVFISFKSAVYLGSKILTSVGFYPKCFCPLGYLNGSAQVVFGQLYAASVFYIVDHLQVKSFHVKPAKSFVIKLSPPNFCYAFNIGGLIVAQGVGRRVLALRGRVSCAHQILRYFVCTRVENFENGIRLGAIQQRLVGSKFNKNCVSVTCSGRYIQYSKILFILRQAVVEVCSEKRIGPLFFERIGTEK